MNPVLEVVTDPQGWIPAEQRWTSRRLSAELLSRLALSDHDRIAAPHSLWLGFVEFKDLRRISSRDPHSVDFLHNALDGREPFIVDGDRSLSVSYRELEMSPRSRETVALLAAELAIAMSIDPMHLTRAEVRRAAPEPNTSRLRVVPD